MGRWVEVSRWVDEEVSQQVGGSGGELQSALGGESAAERIGRRAASDGLRSQPPPHCPPAVDTVRKQPSSTHWLL